MLRLGCHDLTWTLAVGTCSLRGFSGFSADFSEPQCKKWGKFWDEQVDRDGVDAAGTQGQWGQQLSWRANGVVDLLAGLQVARGSEMLRLRFWGDAGPGAWQRGPWCKPEGPGLGTMGRCCPCCPWHFLVAFDMCCSCQPLAWTGSAIASMAGEAEGKGSAKGL